MTIRIEIYKRIYDIHTAEHPYKNPEDNIIGRLNGSCITRSIGTENTGAQFSWFDPGKGLFRIEIGHTDIIDTETYERRVSIEVMPANAELPKELSDLLKGRGLKKE